MVQTSITPISVEKILVRSYPLRRLTSGLIHIIKIIGTATSRYMRTNLHTAQGGLGFVSCIISKSSGNFYRRYSNSFALCAAMR